MKKLILTLLFTTAYQAGPVAAVDLALIDEYLLADVDSDITSAGFASAVASNGEFAVVGAIGQNSFRGKLYLFEFVDGAVPAWQYVKELETPVDQSPGANLGKSLAMNGQWLAAGSRSDGGHLYQRNAGGTDNWGLVKSIREADTTERRIEFFGWDVALYDDTLVVSDLGTDYLGAAAGGGNLNQVGSVFVYERDRGGANNWGQVKRIDIPAADQVALAEFGHSVALDNTTLVVAAIAIDDAAGKVWVFEQNLGGTDNWGMQTELPNPNPVDNARFGQDMVVDGATVMIGAPNGAGDLTPATSNDGAVFVFSRDLGGLNNWGEADPIVPNPATSEFGRALSRASGVLVVGGSLSHFVFEQQVGNWNQTDALLQPFRPTREYGASVDLIERGATFHALIGDPGFVHTPPDSDRWGKAFFHFYSDELFRDGFEEL